MNVKRVKCKYAKIINCDIDHIECEEVRIINVNANEVVIGRGKIVNCRIGNLTYSEFYKTVNTEIENVTKKNYNFKGNV